jgi:hypothetical protein
MIESRLLARVRAANPVPLCAVDGEALRRSIVAGPGDARLLGDAAGRVRNLRLRGRRLPLVLLLVVATGAGGTAGWLGAFGHDSPARLFARDPAAAAAPGTALWHEALRPGTVRLAETFAVPDLGRVQLWTASTAQHGICTALRLPDGVWAGSGTSRFDGGGALPGCTPTRGQINQAMPRPVYAIDGFDYTEGLLRGRDGRLWRVEYGVVSTRGRPAEVTDTVSGIRTRVAAGRYFALVLPVPNPTARPVWHLVARSARGRVLASEP